MKNMSHYLTVAVLITISSVSFAGNESGGGGGVLFRESGPVLVDYLNINPDFKDSNTYQKWEASRITEKSKVEITRENENQVRASNAAYDLALTVLKKWEEAFFGIGAGMVHTSFMSPVIWNFVNKDLKAPSSYLPLENMDADKIKIAAYYHKKSNYRTEGRFRLALDAYETKTSKNKFDVQVSMNIWNQMGILSQSGLLVHEALRHLQLGWANNFDEDSLQHATAILMMCEPDLTLSQYVFYIVQNGRQYGELYIGKFDEVIKTYCKRTL